MFTHLLVKTAFNQAKIQEQINESTRKHLQDYTAALKASNREIGANEAEFAAKTLDGILLNDSIEVNKPSGAQVNAIATATPIQLSEASFTTYTSMMRNYWLRWSDEVDALVLRIAISGRFQFTISPRHNPFASARLVFESVSNISRVGHIEVQTTDGLLLDFAPRSANKLAV